MYCYRHTYSVPVGVSVSSLARPRPTCIHTPTVRSAGSRSSGSSRAREDIIPRRKFDPSDVRGPQPLMSTTIGPLHGVRVSWLRRIHTGAKHFCIDLQPTARITMLLDITDTDVSPGPRRQQISCTKLKWLRGRPSESQICSRPRSIKRRSQSLNLGQRERVFPWISRC